MNRLLPLLLAAASFLPSVTLQAQDDNSPEPPTLYGVKTYCESGCTSGIYSIEAVSDAQPQLYWADGDMIGNGGAVYIEGTYYMLSFLDYLGMQLWSYLVCDIDSKTYDFSMPALQLTDIGSATTYDPVTGNVYSICLENLTSDNTVLTTMDLTTGAKTQVARIDRMAAMAADRAGTLYGIDMKGTLRKINKFTGETETVGSTGVIPNANNSAVIDYATGTMYWNAYTADGSFIYSVDVTTAAVTKLTQLNDNMQIDGLFIRQSALSKAAPGQPSELSLNFEGGSLNGELSFRTPDSDIDGSPLTCDLTCEVTLNGVPVSSITARPGSDAKAPIEVGGPGNYQFSLTVESENGKSVPVTIAAWIGDDKPQPVENCLLTMDGLTAELSWDLPERGANGGYVDPAKVRYVVVRGPYATTLDRNVTATSFSETLDYDRVEPLVYGVYAYVDPTDLTEMTISNAVAAGEFSTVPYTEDFTDRFRQLVFNIYDSNGDDCTWLYSDDFGAMTVMWALDDHSDDWMISYPIRLEAGKFYEAAVEVRSEGQYSHELLDYTDIYCGMLGLSIGRGPTPADMTTQLSAPAEITSKDYHSFTAAPFTVDETGLYHIGMHHSGKRSIYNMIFKGFSLTEASPSAIGNAGERRTLEVASANGILRVDNPDGLRVTVSALDGRTVLQSTAPTVEESLPAGIYLVSAPGAETVKIAVN